MILMKKWNKNNVYLIQNVIIKKNNVKNDKKINIMQIIDLKEKENKR